MRKLLKLFIYFIYIFLALFIQSSYTFACDNFSQTNPQQYYISASKAEKHFINNKEEKDYTIFEKRNNSEISNISNRNNNSFLGFFGKTIVNYDILDKFAAKNAINPICISHNISPNLKNAIYTRAP